MFYQKYKMADKSICRNFLIIRGAEKSPKLLVENFLNNVAKEENSNGAQTQDGIR
jgi:hypothetical protein